MKLVVGLGSIDDYIPYAEAGADECFAGYVPEVWMEMFPNASLNRREVRYYNVQIGSMSELLILRDMIADLKVPVTIAMNAPGFNQEERNLAMAIIESCRNAGFADYIIADGKLIRELEKHRNLNIHLSGEYGELNHLILGQMQEAGVKRIIFPRQTSLAEMEAMITKYPAFEYEAFLFNERCQFTGAYCNSLHCDELCHACRIPYRIMSVDELAEKSEAAENLYTVKLPVENLSANTQESLEADFPLADIPGSSGCGLCKLWQYRRIGITHLKLVSRGNDTESTLSDIAVIRKALCLLEAAETEEQYIEMMKESIFPDGCSGNCY